MPKCKNKVYKSKYGDDSTREFIRLIRWFKACQEKENQYEDIDIDFSLEHDISLMGLIWDPVGNWTCPYTGTFDGNGNHITGLYINASSDAGFFGAIGKEATVSDLHLEGIITGKGITGGITAFNRGGLIDGCSFSEGIIESDSRFAVGGIAGFNTTLGRIHGCTVKNTEISGNSGLIGGIAGVNRNGIIAANLITGGSIGSTRSKGNLGGITYRNNSILLANLAAPDYWGKSHTPGSAGITYENEREVYYSLWLTNAGARLSISEDLNKDLQSKNCIGFKKEEDLSLHIKGMNSDLKTAKIPWRWAISSEGELPTLYRIN